MISCILCSIGLAQVNVIETELQEVMNQRSDEMIDVAIIFKSQMDAVKLQSKAERSGDKALKREIVISELKDFSLRQQSDVMAVLHAEQASGNVADIESLWIVNSISCKATRDVIYKLSQHPDVAKLSYDKEIKLISDEQMAETMDVEARRGPAAHIVTIRANRVWSEYGYTGKNVVVAVLDTGVNYEHKDIKDNLWEGEVDTDNDNIPDMFVNGWNTILDNANILDDNGHGTHCAGIVCGNGTSGTTTGVAPDAKLMAVKVVGAAATGSVSNMISGVQFAVENGADILSLSLGFNNNQLSVAQKESIRETFDNVLTADVIVCAAAGNDGNNYGAPNNVDYPAACPSPWRNPAQTLEGGLSSVVCVGANDLIGQSSQGPSTWEDTKYNDYIYNEGESMGLIRPDISAPGDLIYSLNHTQNNAYKLMSGSSQSTPAVAGVMALMLEKNSSLTPAQITEIIETTAADKPTSKNNIVGAGRVDAFNAVANTTEGEKSPYLRLVSFSPKNVAPGNNVEIKFSLKNEGKGSSSNDAQVLVSLNNDQYVNMDNKLIEVGSLDNEEIKEFSFTLNVGEQVADGHVINFNLNINDGDYTWKDNFSVKVTSLPNIVYKSSTPSIIRPEDGNVSLVVTMVNNGMAPSLNETKITLSAISNSLEHITIEDNEATIGALNVNETATATFTISAKEDAADNYLVDFFLETLLVNDEESDVIYEFENSLDGWTSFDAANNEISDPWWHSSEAFFHGKTPNDSHSGSGHLMSETRNKSLIDFTYPIDNYLVSPNKMKITENSTFSFYARANHAYYYPEHFGVAISENSSETDFTTIQDWTITQQQGTNWNKYTVNLSAYAGQEIYVAIRHYFTEEEWENLDNGFDVEALCIDDIVLSDVIVDYHHVPSYDDTDENYFNVVVSNPVDLDAPTGLAASNITTESLTLSWDALEKAQSYNVYRDGELKANVTGTTYNDNNLTHNTQYCYTVAGMNNDYEHEQSDELCVTTAQKDYSVAIQSVTPTEVFYDGSNINLIITFVNDGKEEHQSRCYFDVESSDEYVTVIDDKQTNAVLASGATATKTFGIKIDEEIPNDYEIAFNASVDYMFTPQQGAYDGPQQSWDIPFTLFVKNDVNTPKNLAVIAKNENSITLTWDANANAIRYNVYRDDEYVGHTTATTYIDGGLEPETEYRYSVTSVTADGESERSKELAVTTNKVSNGIILHSFTMGSAIGEYVELTATLINKGSETTPDETTATLSCDDDLVEIKEGTYDIGSIAPGATAIAVFTIKLDKNIPSNYKLDFNVTTEYQSTGTSYQNYEYSFDTDFEGWGNYSWHSNGYKWEWSDGLLKSYSWKGKSITPDAYIVSPEKITIGQNTQLVFDVDPTGNNYYEEHYSINVSEVSPESYGYEAGQFTEIYNETLNTTDKQERVINLNDYPSAAGKNVHIIIRHHDCSNQDAITIDNIKILNALVEGNTTISHASSFSVIANQSLNIFEGTGLWSDATLWSKGSVPASTDDVIVAGNATIERESGNITVNTLSIEEGSLTMNGGALTVSGLLVNTDADAFVINNGAQVIQNNDNVAATFKMNVTNWNDVNSWQFIASPVKDIEIESFIPTEGSYDLFKYDGTKQDAEWVNYRAHVADFEETFKQGRGYLVSYETETSATFKGIINKNSSFTFSDVKANDEENYYANFYLLGNPFTFNMNIANLVGLGMETGIAVINETGNGYEYRTAGSVKVGEGFFVKTADATASLSYSEGTKRGEEKVPSINLIATSKAGNDNVIIRFAGEMTEGFNKLDNFDRSIAEIYVAENGNRYGIKTYNENTTEVEVNFHANEMGNYTIAIVESIEVANDFEQVILVDKFSGVETNLLIEDYHFTATGGDDVNRFIVKLAVSDQQSAVSDNFVYQSGEELVIDAEGTVQIIDVMGRVVYSDDVESTNNRIDVSGFRNGTYVVRVISGSEVKVEKVVIY